MSCDFVSRIRLASFPLLNVQFTIALSTPDCLRVLCDVNQVRAVCATPYHLWSWRMQQMQESGFAEEPKARGRHRSIEAKTSILKATLQLLGRKPLRKVTADAIAKRAGVSKATIYKWWPNKTLVAFEAYFAGMTERVADPDTGSAETDFILQL